MDAISKYIVLFGTIEDLFDSSKVEGKNMVEVKKKNLSTLIKFLRERLKKYFYKNIIFIFYEKKTHIDYKFLAFPWHKY